jgi:hypothetical protein
MMTGTRGPQPQFPANREIYREFSQKRQFGTIFVPNFFFVFRGLHAKFPTRPNREFFQA